MYRVRFCDACRNVMDRETACCVACGAREELQTEEAYLHDAEGGAARKMQARNVEMWWADPTVPRFLMDCGHGCGGQRTHHLWIDPNTVVCRTCCGCSPVR